MNTLLEMDWYSHIDQEYEWLRDFVYNPTETWNKALTLGGKNQRLLLRYTRNYRCLHTIIFLVHREIMQFDFSKISNLIIQKLVYICR